jgi:hypothetical protein
VNDTMTQHTCMHMTRNAKLSPLNKENVQPSGTMTESVDDVDLGEEAVVAPVLVPGELLHGDLHTRRHAVVLPCRSQRDPVQRAEPASSKLSVAFLIVACLNPILSLLYLEVK